MSDCIRVGVIGTGRVAQLHHLPNLAATARARISAVCDLSYDLATLVAEQYHLPSGSVAETADDLLCRDLDAVVISNRHHGPLVRQALEAGLHVFVEKPVCWGLEEGIALANLEQRTRPAVVGYMKRYDPALVRLLESDRHPILIRLHVYSGARHRYEKLHDRIKHPDAGQSDISAEEKAINDLISTTLGSAETDRVLAVRTLAELVAHDLNLARAMVGPMAVESALRFDTPFGHGFLVALNAAGTPVSVEVVPDFQTARDWDEGITISFEGLTTELRFGSPFLRSAPTTVVDHFADGIDIVDRSVIVSRESPYRRELEHFLNCVSGQAESCTPISEAVADLALVYDIVNELKDLLSVTGLLAIHGLKRRHVAATTVQGLIRSSSAWFVCPREVSRAEYERTIAAATYLALAPATRGRLAEMTRPGTYTAYFESDRELMPAILFFADQVSGREEWHRYIWTGMPSTGVTAPYTKVARAARFVSLRGRATYIAEADIGMVARAEALADGAGPFGGGRPSGELTRIPADSPMAIAPSSGPGGKVMHFCAALAAHLRSAAAADVGWLVTGTMTSETPR